MATVDKSVLEGKVLPELQEMASNLGVEGYQRLKKGDLIDAIIKRGEGEGGGGNGGEAAESGSTN
ncbi:MAG: Rho termination factor N-terminal domain-containing protein, partial [Actinomycetota bacterium]|nr:Rho termination factor N-terminal domain-containing protein [Actinomycetota bacterium]